MRSLIFLITDNLQFFSLQSKFVRYLAEFKYQKYRARALFPRIRFASFFFFLLIYLRRKSQCLNPAYATSQSTNREFPFFFV